MSLLMKCMDFKPVTKLKFCGSNTSSHHEYIWSVSLVFFSVIFGGYSITKTLKSTGNNLENKPKYLPTVEINKSVNRYLDTIGLNKDAQFYDIPDSEFLKVGDY